MTMFPIVTLGTKYLYFLGSILLAATISTSSTNTTGVNGGAILVPDFTSAGVASRNAVVPVRQQFIAYVRSNTGSTTIRYPASCFPNVLKGRSRGSGTVLRLTYHSGPNPAGVGGDIGFVKSCGAAGGSGSDLINDVCTASGCVSHYTTGTAAWNDADFIKFTPRANLGSTYTGRITGEVQDIWGE